MTTAARAVVCDVGCVLEPDPRIYLLTCGGAGIWAIVDIIMIATGSFTDKEGRKLSKE